MRLHQPTQLVELHGYFGIRQVLRPGQRWMWSLKASSQICIESTFPFNTLTGAASIGIFGESLRCVSLQQVNLSVRACLSYDLWPEYLASH